MHMPGVPSFSEPSTGSVAIDAVLREERRFPPPPAFAATANVRDPGVYERARQDPERFWAEAAARLDWFKPWDRVLEWNAPWARWFVGGQLNAAYNCVDRHVATWRRNKAAIIWEGEPGDTCVLTYWDLYREINRAAAALLDLGVRTGDRVALYLPMIPELPIAMLACARIGAPHIVIFSGSSAQALRDRIDDAQARVIITADGGWRHGAVVPLKQIADDAVRATPSVENVLVVRRAGPQRCGITLQEGRDVWWHEALANVSRRTVPPEPLDSEHPLYLLYTSGVNDRAAGHVHTTGGYLVGTALTQHWVFDLKEDDVYWCTADIGWVTGHSCVVYGPLANGATCVIYEGAPEYPDKDRFWAIVEKYGVTILYTAPTVIRTCMQWGTAYPARHGLSTLRLLGTAGEPINPEAWMWYHEFIGGGRCPIVDTWWQTETGTVMIGPLPGLVTAKPGSVTLPFPGVAADIFDEQGHSVGANTGGNLVITRPWPAMSRTIWGDPDRYVQTYWSRYQGVYLTGDGARRDTEGYFWLLGRMDDVVNVSGHRLSSAELESALVSHPAVAEAAVIGVTHPTKGQAVVAFVALRAGHMPGEALRCELQERVVQAIGVPDGPMRLYFMTELPKARNAKVMRGLLRDLIQGELLGDITPVMDSDAVP